MFARQELRSLATAALSTYFARRMDMTRALKILAVTLVVGFSGFGSLAHSVCRNEYTYRPPTGGARH